MALNFNIALSEPKTRVYKFRYFFGVWISKENFAAESDAEAIYDADEIFRNSKLQDWNYPVALFCGNRKVKTYRVGI